MGSFWTFMCILYGHLCALNWCLTNQWRFYVLHLKFMEVIMFIIDFILLESTSVLHYMCTGLSTCSFYSYIIYTTLTCEHYKLHHGSFQHGSTDLPVTGPHTNSERAGQCCTNGASSGSYNCLLLCSSTGHGSYASPAPSWESPTSWTKGTAAYSDVYTSDQDKRTGSTLTTSSSSYASCIYYIDWRTLECCTTDLQY